MLRQQGLDLLHKRRFGLLRSSQWSKFLQPSKNRCSLEDQSFLHTLRKKRFQQTHKCLQDEGQVENHGWPSETGVQVLVLVRAGREGLGESLIRCLADAANVVGKDHRAHSARPLRPRVSNQVMHLLGVQKEVANLLDGGLIHELLVIDGTGADHVPDELVIDGTDR